MIHSAPCHHEHIGIVECANDVITAWTRAMLLDTILLDHLWPFVVLTSMYLTNHLPTSVNLGHILPIQYLPQTTHRSYVPNTKYLRTYGSLSYVHIALEMRLHSEKFIVRARKGFLVG